MNLQVLGLTSLSQWVDLPVTLFNQIFISEIVTIITSLLQPTNSYMLVWLGSKYIHWNNLFSKIISSFEIPLILKLLLIQEKLSSYITSLRLGHLLSLTS